MQAARILGKGCSLLDTALYALYQQTACKYIFLLRAVKYLYTSIIKPHNWETLACSDDLAHVATNKMLTLTAASGNSRTFGIVSAQLI